MSACGPSPVWVPGYDRFEAAVRKADFVSCLEIAQRVYTTESMLKQVGIDMGYAEPLVFDPRYGALLALYADLELSRKAGWEGDTGVKVDFEAHYPQAYITWFPSAPMPEVKGKDLAWFKDSIRNLVEQAGRLEHEPGVSKSEHVKAMTLRLVHDYAMAAARKEDQRELRFLSTVVQTSVPGAPGLCREVTSE